VENFPRKKLLITLTPDGDFHFAMDGKLVGILDPNDAKCHLNGSIGESGNTFEVVFNIYKSMLRWRSGSIVDFEAVGPRFQPSRGQKVFNIKTKETGLEMEEKQ